MTNTLQRDQWDGHPVDLGDAWTLRKGELLGSLHPVQPPIWLELRLMVGELVRSQVCRTQDEILATQDSWKVAMLGRGWG